MLKDRDHWLTSTCPDDRPSGRYPGPKASEPKPRTGNESSSTGDNNTSLLHEEVVNTTSDPK